MRPERRKDVRRPQPRSDRANDRIGWSFEVIAVNPTTTTTTNSTTLGRSDEE